MSTLVAINDLAFARPAVDAPAAAVAAWYERKALVLHEVASESVSDQDVWKALASAAHDHAVRLLAGGSR